MASKQREEVTDSITPHEEDTHARRPPLVALTFVRKATNVDPSTSVPELRNRIYGGVLMNDNENTLKFWVDKVLDKNCFLVLAKQLAIAWISSPEYWGRVLGLDRQKEKCYSGEVDVPVAKLKKVCFLHIEGTFKTILLSPKTTSEVAFVVKIEKSSRWYLPVNLNLTLPDKTTQGRIENLEQKKKGEWTDILVGTFVTTPENVGEISFSFSETGGNWKSGLLLNGVALRPKD